MNYTRISEVFDDPITLAVLEDSYHSAASFLGEDPRIGYIGAALYDDLTRRFHGWKGGKLRFNNCMLVRLDYILSPNEVQWGKAPMNFGNYNDA